MKKVKKKVSVVILSLLMALSLGSSALSAIRAEDEEMPVEVIEVVEEETTVEEEPKEEVLLEEEESLEVASEEEKQEEVKEEAPVEEEKEAEVQEEVKEEPAPEVVEEKKEEAPVEEKKEEPQPTEAKKEEPKEEVVVVSPAFAEEKEVDGVKVSVEAPEGVFPVGSTLAVEKVEEKELEKVETALEEVREEDVNVAVSYTFDIKVLDANGNEVQPTDKAKVKVSFVLAEVENNNLTTNVYHVNESEDIKAEDIKVLEVQEDGDVAVVETEGFSYYTVEFTYNNLEYVLEGDGTVALSTVLETLGLTGNVSNVEVSNPELFKAEVENGAWVIKSLQPFTSTEWMKVTIDDVVYEVVVTDQVPGNPVTGEPKMNNGETKTGDFTIVIGPVHGPNSGSAYIKNGTVTNNAVNDKKGGVSASEGSAFIAENDGALDFEKVTINTSSHKVVFNIWANGRVTTNGLTLNGPKLDKNKVFILVGNYNASGAGKLNFTGDNFFKGVTGTIDGANSGSVINIDKNGGSGIGSLTLEDSQIVIDNGISLSVNSGATLTLKGNSSLEGKVTVKSGATLDITEWTGKKVTDIPSTFTFESGSTIKAKEYEVTSGSYTVQSGQTLKLNDDKQTWDWSAASSNNFTYRNAKVVADTYKFTKNVTFYVYGTCDVTADETVTSKNMNSKFPRVYFRNGSTLKVVKHEINPLNINNGKDATIDDEGNVTGTALEEEQTATLNGYTVKVQAEECTLAETAPINVNNGGKLYFDNVNLDDKHKITINNGGIAYLVGENHFGSESQEITIQNNGKILVDPEKNEASIKDSNLKLNGPGTLEVGNGQKLLIDPTTLTPTGMQQIIVASGATLTLEDTTIDLANHGAIRYIKVEEGGTLNIKNCTIKNSPTCGVIRSLGGTINIEGSTFENNKSAPSSAGDAMQKNGGVILAEQGSKIDIKTSKFDGNWAVARGGVIYAKDDSEITIDDESTFTNNEAVYWGGAINIQEGDNKLTIGASTFEGNKSQNGGAISIGIDKDEKAETGTNTAAFNGTQFKKNIADIAVLQRPAYGGAVHIQNGSQLDINGCLFEENEAKTSGGALTVFTDAVVHITSLNDESGVDQTQFLRNKVFRGLDHSGGALFINAGKVVLEDAAIYGNYARDGGGGLSSCTKGAAQAKVLDGSAIFDNYVGGQAGNPVNPIGEDGVPQKDVMNYQDIYFQTKDHKDAETGEDLRPEGGDGEYVNVPIQLYERMFNGGLHKWSVEVYRSLNDNRDPAVYLNSLMARSNPTSTDISKAKVVFTQNIATSDLTTKPDTNKKTQVTGGAIASNGLLEMGEGTEIKIVKVWDDELNHDGYRPELDDSFINNLVVYADGVELDLQEYIAAGLVSVVDFNDFDPAALANNVVNFDEYQRDYTEEGFGAWVVVVSGLPLTDKADGHIIQYSIKEKDVNYYSNIKNIGDNDTFFEMTNKHLRDKVDIKAIKVWDDSDNQDAVRPDSVTVKLLADGEEIDQGTLSEDNAWTVEFNDLDRYKQGGEEIKYEVVEDSVERYAVEYIYEKEEETAKKTETVDDKEVEVDEIHVKTTITITNSYETEKVNVYAQKIWEDDNNMSGNRPSEITVNLLKDGEVIATTTASEETDWLATFENLDKYENGVRIEYAVEEEPIGFGYELVGIVEKARDDVSVRFEITNKYDDLWNQGPVAVYKVDENGKPLKGAQFKIVNADGDTVAEWTSDGEAFTTYLRIGEYTLTEVSAPNGYKVITDITFRVENTNGKVTLVKTGETTVTANDNEITVTNKPEETPGKVTPKPKTPGRPVVPYTGDNTNLGMYIGLLVVALASILFSIKATKAAK